MTALARIRAFVRLGRPLFLGGGFVLYALGAALALFATTPPQPLDWRRYLWGQLAVTATQLMTHYANDYFDLGADRANTTPTRWSGGSRVLTAGTLPPAVALVTALALALVALATAAHFADGTFPRAVAPQLVLMVALSWAYSAPPLRLHSRGLGELTTAVVVTLLVPWLAFVLQAGTVRPLLVLSAAPLCALQFAMLLAIEFPDAAGDSAVGKRTLVVRWGGQRAARLYMGLVCAAYLSLPLLVAGGLPRRLAIAVATTIPLALWLVARVARGGWRRPEQWEGLAFGSVALLIATAVAQLVAVLGGAVTLGSP